MARYIIIKTLASEEGKKPLKVILLDGHSAVLEIEGQEKAQKMCDVFQENSDSGHTYEIQKIGK